MFKLSAVCTGHSQDVHALTRLKELQLSMNLVLLLAPGMGQRLFGSDRAMSMSKRPRSLGTRALSILLRI
jgi:hypothetical protein